MLLLDLRTRVVVRVPIPLAVADFAHQRRRRVPEMEGDGVGARSLDVLLHIRVRRVQGIALGRRREVDDGLGQRQVRLRHTDEVRSLLRGHRLGQGLRVGETDVF